MYVRGGIICKLKVYERGVFFVKSGLKEKGVGIRNRGFLNKIFLRFFYFFLGLDIIRVL